jgi:hypothetical protein
VDEPQKACMRTSKRRLLGLLLICVSVLAWIVSLVFFSHARTLGSGYSGNDHWIAVEVHQDLGRGFKVPVMMCGVAGVLLLAWPSRKPPELSGGTEQ